MPASIHDEPTLPSTGDPAQEPYKPFQSPVVISTFNNVYCLMVCVVQEILPHYSYMHTNNHNQTEKISLSEYLAGLKY